jgi:DeoR/GlpR family transcriptional regulator of sugar metabolism
MKSPPKRLRQESILAELRASPAIRIAELAATHSVSTETIRRDLDELSAEGLISRTYGGATGAPLAAEPLLDDRYRANVEQRTAMAKATAHLVNKGDSLMIDAGATTIYVARRLAAELSDLTVVTNSFGVATALAANPSIRILMCPGQYDPSDGGVTGPETLAYLRTFSVATTIIGASRMDVEGPSDFNSAAVWVKRTMIERSKETVLVLANSKFEQKAFENVCELGAVDHLVTDSTPPKPLAKALRAAGVRVHVA